MMSTEPLQTRCSSIDTRFSIRFGRAVRSCLHGRFAGAVLRDAYWLPTVQAAVQKALTPARFSYSNIS